MRDDLRRFSTNAFPDELRQSAWSEALARALIANAPATRALPPLDGCVFSRVSPLDSVFMTLLASPQAWVPHPGNGRRYGGAVLVLALLEGSGLVIDGGETVALGAGEIMLLDPAGEWRIELHTTFRAAVVKMESASFVRRLVHGRSPSASKLASSGGMGTLCINLVRTLADELEQLRSHELLPIEATLAELLLACLSHADHALAEDSTSLRLAHLRRVCRTLESRLGDAELSIDVVGRVEGLSPRYIQTLFKDGATTFGEYLKERRLERCRIDLSNRSLAHFTIAELCFRWGFGDAANFSRAFTARFGLSPKACRCEPMKEGDEPVQAQRGRPLKARALEARGRDVARQALVTGRAALVDGGRATDAASTASRASPFIELLSDHARYALALALAPKRALQPAGPPATGSGTQPSYYYLPVSDKTVHWGYLSRSIKPVLSVRSGDVVTIETLTQHASDDPERMIDGDPGAESVFHWTAERKAVDRRGAGPMDASTFGRGAGEGFGVHICTGPVYVESAEPGDVLEVRILDIRPRPSCSAPHRGKVFGSNAAAWWGFHFRDLLTEPKQREVVTIYEIHADADEPFAKAVYNFRWTPQTDPYGVRHETIDYPGVPVDPAKVQRRYGVLANAQVPIRPHFGLMAVAPKECGLVDSVPPGYFGGNLDNWRAGKGARLFLPVSAPGALFSVGDPHASQGDSEVCGTAIECSLTGVFQLVLHKRESFGNGFLADLNYPFLETPDAWVLQGFSYPNHLAELGTDAQARIYEKSSLDLAMRDAFRKARRYLMKAHGLDEDEAISLLSVAVDFGVTQVVDGNWGVHAVISKAVFPGFGDSGGLNSR